MLICDKRRPRTRGDTNIRPPRGPNKAAPGLRPAPRALLGVGARPGPLGCAPGAPSRTGPLLPRHPAGGFRARVRRWRGWAACGCPCRRLAPGGFRASGKFKGGQCEALRGFGGVPPLCDGGQPGPGGGRPGCSRRLCPPSTDWARLSTGGSRRSGSSEQSNRANIFSFAQPTRAKPRQYWVSREPLYKKIGDPDCTTLCNLTTKMQSKQQLSTF